MKTEVIIFKTTVCLKINALNRNKRHFGFLFFMVGFAKPFHCNKSEFKKNMLFNIHPINRAFLTAP